MSNTVNYSLSLYLIKRDLDLVFITKRLVVGECMELCLLEGQLDLGKY